jgi:hypothetical protein
MKLFKNDETELCLSLDILFNISCIKYDLDCTPIKIALWVVYRNTSERDPASVFHKLGVIKGAV